LQNARTLTRLEIFGYPDDNVMFVNAFVTEMQSRHHDVYLVTKNSTEVGKMLDEMILGEQIALCKTQGKKMLKQDKIDYMKGWKSANMNMLIESGLDLVTQGPNKPSFVTGFSFLYQLQGQQFHTYSKFPTLMHVTQVLASTPSTQPMGIPPTPTHLALDMELCLETSLRRIGWSS
jgi:hypothetical protein